MKLRNAGASIHVPDGTHAEAAIARTTHLAIGAHQDDIPIMAYHGILNCFGRADRWFLGVTVTDGGGSSRSGIYADYTDEQMQAARSKEEIKAASIGEYTAAIQLAYSSAAVKDESPDAVVAELADIVARAGPRVVYTHNPADRHETHVAVAMRTVDAIRSLPADARPHTVYGCEVWGDLDWLTDEDRVALDVSAKGKLSADLLRTYESQIAGGKRYDLATEGRRLAHATFSASHAVDQAEALTYAMDLTPLIADVTADVPTYVASLIERMQREVSDRIRRLS